VVLVAKEGRQRLYRLDAQKLKSVYEWAKSFERLWSHQLDRIKRRAEQMEHLSLQKTIAKR
jgi:hypothetical protein